MLLKQRRKPPIKSLIKHPVSVRNTRWTESTSSVLEQGEKLKRQASDAGDKVKAAAKDAKKKAEKQGEGALEKLFSVLNDVKKSIFGE